MVKMAFLKIILFLCYSSIYNRQVTSEDLSIELGFPYSCQYVLNLFCSLESSWFLKHVTYHIYTRLFYRDSWALYIFGYSFKTEWEHPFFLLFCYTSSHGCFQFYDFGSEEFLKAFRGGKINLICLCPVRNIEKLITYFSC